MNFRKEYSSVYLFFTISLISLLQERYSEVEFNNILRYELNGEKGNIGIEKLA